MNNSFVVDRRRISAFTERGYESINDELVCKEDATCIVYWMSRDQRITDNWALIACMEQSQKRQLPIRILFTLVPEFLDATIRQYDFMIKGLEEVQQQSLKLGIPFHLILDSDPAATVTAFADTYNAGMIITDFDPLKIKLEWKRKAGIS